MAGEEVLTSSWCVNHLAQSGTLRAFTVFQEFLPWGSHRSAVAMQSKCSPTKSNNERLYSKPRPKMDAVADEPLNPSKNDLK
jgi:hypothetical protein